MYILFATYTYIFYIIHLISFNILICHTLSLDTWHDYHVHWSKSAINHLSKLASTWLPSALGGKFCENTPLDKTVDATKVTAFSRIEMLRSCFAGHEIQHHDLIFLENTFLAVRLLWHGSMFKATQNTSGTPTVSKGWFSVGCILKG